MLQIVDQQSKAHPVTADDLLAIFSNLKEDFPVEYKTFDCSAIALSQLLPVLKPHVASWPILHDPLHWLHTFTAWKALLQAPRSAISLADLNEGLSDPFAELLMEAVFPVLQRAVMAAWNPMQPGQLLVFFENWIPILPVQVSERMLKSLVLPRVRGAIEAWDPRLNPAASAVHLWLHPWLPYIADSLQDLYHLIRSKLASFLQVWPTASIFSRHSEPRR
jgi:tuftelin-interacting protein 11